MMRIKVIHETSKCSEVAKNFILINVDINARLKTRTHRMTKRIYLQIKNICQRDTKTYKGFLSC